jgi:hypothetical protein
MECWMGRGDDLVVTAKRKVVVPAYNETHSYIL